MSAILELKETPESCIRCPLAIEKPAVISVDKVCKRIGNPCFGITVTNYINIRHPDCPLKITEDNLRWIREVKSYTGDVIFICPKCEEAKFMPYNFCPSCGVKLLPPENKEESC